MANSGTVSAGSVALASQYNNLRADVLSTTTGHVHDGTTDGGKQVEGTVIKSTGAANGRVLMADGSNATSWGSVSTNVGTFTSSTVTYDFGTPNDFSESYTNTQFPSNTTTFGIGGGGSVILAGAQRNTAASSKYWNTFNFATTRVVNTAAVAFGTSGAIAPSPAGTIQNDGISGLDAQEAASTAVYWSERWATNTAGSAYASIRKYNTALSTAIWNAVVYGPASTFPTSLSSIPLRTKYVSGPNNWIGGIWFQDSASTAQVFAVNDASGSVFKANFSVNSAGTNNWVVTDVAYVPPVTGDGTVWAIGTGSIGGTATAYRRVAYTMTNAALTAASTADNWTPVGTAAGFSGIFWDSVATAIIWRSTDTYYGIDRTFGTQTFSSTASYTNVRAQVRYGNYGFGANTISSSNTNSRVGVFGTAGSFYAPAKNDPTADVPRPVLVNGTVVGYVESSEDGVSGTAFSYLISRLRNDSEVILASASYGRLVSDQGTSPTLTTNRTIADDRITFATGATYLPAGGSVVLGVTGGTTVSGTITRTVRTIDMK